MFPLFIVRGAVRSTFLHADWRAATALALGVLLTGLTCGYYSVFLSLLALPTALPFMCRRTLSVRVVMRLLLPLAIAAGLLTPLLVGQAARLSDSIRNNSAGWEDYFRAAPETISARVFPTLAGRGRGGQRLYPGTGLAVLALLGSAWLVRHRQGRLLISAWLLIAVGLVLSVTLRLEFDQWQPYAFLRLVHPNFSQLRSPLRVAVFVQIALVGLAGWGVAMLWRRSMASVTRRT